MNKKSLDPAGHLTLAVSDLVKSKKFYINYTIKNDTPLKTVVNS